MAIDYFAQQFGEDIFEDYVAPPTSTVSTADILGWFNANPGADDTLIATTMQAAGVSPAQLASALNVDVGDVTL